MIEIGRNFLAGLSNAQQQVRSQKKKYKTLAAEAEEETRSLPLAYQDKMAYLFRTSNERMRLAYNKARQALAARQALRAAHGVNDTSASAAQEGQNVLLNQSLEDLQTRQALQQAASEEEKKFTSRWNALLDTVATYRKMAKKSGKLGAFGRAVVSLFK